MTWTLYVNSEKKAAYETKAEAQAALLQALDKVVSQEVAVCMANHTARGVEHFNKVYGCNNGVRISHSAGVRRPVPTAAPQRFERVLVYTGLTMSKTEIVELP